MGRFLTRDTYTGEDHEPESLHLYAYCGYDGVNAWDPSGHCISKNYVGAKSGTLYGAWAIVSRDDGISWSVSENRLFMIRIKGRNKIVRQNECYEE